MRVIKVLNNSLVLALNDEGQEIILMGKGIAGSSGWPPRQTASILRWPSLSSTMPWRTTT